MLRPVLFDVILAVLRLIFIFYLAIFEFVVLLLLIIMSNYYIRGSLLVICRLARGREVFIVDSSNSRSQIAAVYVFTSSRVG